MSSGQLLDSNDIKRSRSFVSICRVCVQWLFKGRVTYQPWISCLILYFRLRFWSNDPANKVSSGNDSCDVKTRSTNFSAIFKSLHMSTHLSAVLLSFSMCSRTALRPRTCLKGRILQHDDSTPPVKSFLQDTRNMCYREVQSTRYRCGHDLPHSEHQVDCRSANCRYSASHPPNCSGCPSSCQQWLRPARTVVTQTSETSCFHCKA